MEMIEGNVQIKGKYTLFNGVNTLVFESQEEKDIYMQQNYIQSSVIEENIQSLYQRKDNMDIEYNELKNRINQLDEEYDLIFNKIKQLNS